MIEDRQFIVTLTDLTGIDIGVTSAEIHVTATSPQEAERYVRDFTRRTQIQNYEATTREA